MGNELGAAAGTGNEDSAATAYLEQRGYFPSLEQQEGLITLQLANCPYLEVAEGASSLCQFDLALIEGLFGRKVDMRGRIVNNQPVCTFEITP